ncbi:MAG TPA: class I SAM-dependent methyltransferase [Candidatus Binataceae bacterium]|nr:class I SAM-dependent methyltransferase [Candidatus Binataceae bacterium]
MSINPLLQAHTRATERASPQERNRQWWERLPMTYEDWQSGDRSTNRERVIEKFLSSNPYLDRQYFNQFAGKRVLEIGCGAGPATCLFASFGAAITSVDLTQSAVEMTHLHEPRATVLQMDAEALTFADASFDHVFSWGVIHHTANPTKAFGEIARVLRPGGTALLMVYNRASLRYWIKGAIWLFLRGRLWRGETFTTVQRFFTDGYFHRHYTPSELPEALWPLQITDIAISHMSGRMLPLLPRRVDEWCKRRWGWLLIANTVRKPGRV